MANSIIVYCVLTQFCTLYGAKLTSPVPLTEDKNGNSSVFTPDSGTIGNPRTTTTATSRIRDNATRKIPNGDQLLPVTTCISSGNDINISSNISRTWHLTLLKIKKQLQQLRRDKTHSIKLHERNVKDLRQLAAKVRELEVIVDKERRYVTKGLEKIRNKLLKLSTVDRGRACPTGYLQYKKSCYRFNLNAHTWFTARRQCHRDGASLVSIESKKEQSFLKKTIKKTVGKLKVDGFYTSGRNTDYQLRRIYWHWNSTEEGVRYTSWCDGQPHVTGNVPGFSKAYCIQLNRKCRWKWADIACSRERPFICERAL